MLLLSYTFSVYRWTREDELVLLQDKNMDMEMATTREVDTNDPWDNLLDGEEFSRLRGL